MADGTCCICGRALGEPAPAREPDGVFAGWEDVALQDGKRVCSDCAARVRIVCPLRSSKTFVECSARFGSTDHYGKSIPGRGWINALVDPLTELTEEGFRQVMDDAEQAVREQAARFPGAKAAAEADFTFRHHVRAGGTDQKPRYSEKQEYFTCVKVLYGEIRPGDEISVVHKDREYSAKVEEVWFWNYLDSPQRPIDKAFAGVTAALLFHQEVPFIYPGDILVVKGS